METFIKNVFAQNWQRIFFSLVAAVVIWMIVSASITTVRVFTRVPVRIVNLPPNKTIRGLMPDGLLDRRMTVTVTGTKDIIDKLGPQGFEVVLDASDRGDEWVAKLSNNNLVSLNPDVSLVHAVRQLSYSELIIRLCPLVTMKIPVFIRPPKEEAPEGYQFLDIWPQKLYQVVSGPEEDVKQLQEEGLELHFDLSEITPEQLDSLQGEGPDEDEVSFFVPDGWKKVRIPFLHNAVQALNSPEARQLRIDFLHKALLPIDGPLPIRVFYPRATLTTLNPSTVLLQPNDVIKQEKGVSYVDQRLFVNEVSRLFLDIVRDRLEIVLVPTVKESTVEFRWDVQFIDPKRLEETYVTIALANEFDTDAHIGVGRALRQHLAERERFFRARFQNYLRHFQLYRAKDLPFMLSVTRDLSGRVIVTERSA